MSEKNIASAVAYYQAINDKKSAVLEKYLHPEVRLITPMADIFGKDTVLNAVKNFLTVINKLTIRAQAGNEDRVMLVYEVEFPAPIGLSQAACLLTFQDGLIIRYELFYDARPFEKKQEEIFK